MSVLAIGANDVTEAQQAAKDLLSNKDSEIAAQKTQLMRKNEELDELKATLSDAIHKLNAEAARALSLENNLRTTTQSLQNERLGKENAQTTLITTVKKLEEKALEAKQLESTLDTISRHSGSSDAKVQHLEKEKAKLDARVKELQENLRTVSGQENVAPPGKKSGIPAPRARSSSVSNAKTISLENELSNCKSLLQQREGELKTKERKLQSLQSEIIKAENERIALQRRLEEELQDLQGQLEDKEDELHFLRETHAGGDREEELLKRIDEDEAKINALEMLADEAHEVGPLREKLRIAKEQLNERTRRLEDAEMRNVDLAQDKEGILDELEDAKERIQELTIQVSMSERRQDHPPGTPLLVVHGPEDDTQVTHVPNDQTVIHIERLLAATERLRGERDDLRREIQFLETESGFAVEDLEARIKRLLDENEIHEHELEAQFTEEIRQMKSQWDDNSSRHAAAVHAYQGEITRLGTAVVATAVLLQYSLDHPEAEATPVSGGQTLSDLKSQLEALEEKLNITMQCLTDTTEERNSLMSEAASREEEWTNERRNLIASRDELQKEFDSTTSRLQECMQGLEESEAQHQALSAELDRLTDELTARQQVVEEARVRDDKHRRLQGDYKELIDRFEGVTARLDDANAALEETEAERDSLSLEAMNLKADLETAQTELNEAETRYSSLQFHQLSSMSSNEASKVLRRQIEELEGRVLRRTELVGVQQQDIRRLETNLRLQEERLYEMTVELDTMAGEKDAMVEDCADAREARDEAVRVREELEIQVEDMEIRLVDSEKSTEQLVRVWADAVLAARVIKRQAAEQSSRASVQLSDAYAEQQSSYTPDDTQSSGQSSQSELMDMTEDLRGLVLALATSSSALSSQAKVSATRASVVSALSKDLEQLQTRLDSELAISTEAKGQLAQIQIEREMLESTQRDRIQQLETELLQSRQALSMAQTQHQKAMEDLQGSLKEKEDLLASGDDTEAQLVQLRMKHVEENGALQSRLVEMASALEECQARCEDAEQRYTDSVADFQRQLQDASRVESLHRETQAELARNREDHSREISVLKQRFEGLEDELSQTKASRNDLDRAHNRKKEELMKAQEQHQQHIGELKSAITELEGKFAAQSQRADEFSTKAKDLQQALERANKDREAESKRHDIASTNFQTFQIRSEERNQVLAEELAETQAQLQKCAQDLEDLQGELSSVQLSNTALEGEHQRSISLTRHLERQIEEGERERSSLKTELQSVRSDLARVESARHALELKQNMGDVHHQRELATLHQKIEELRAEPDLQDALAELEERNNEMEELLRQKTTEIEENDDRSLEMMKENKKLNTKVETLTRKVQNLQTKLAAAKAIKQSSESSPSEPLRATVSTSRISPSTSKTQDRTPPQPVPNIPSGSRSRTSTMTSVSSAQSSQPSVVSRAPSNRAVSSSSSIQRPKTPEKKAFSVFRALSPKKDKSRDTTPLPDAPAPVFTAAKRREPPTEFVERPAMGFEPTAEPRRDSPELDGTTPRARRVLQSLQSGFTPVRSHARPIAPLPARRAENDATPSSSSPYLSEPLNGNHMRSISHTPSSSSSSLAIDTEKANKRGWLGRIRGVSTVQPPNQGAHPISRDYA